MLALLDIAQVVRVGGMQHMPPEPFYSTVEVWRLLPCDEGALRGRHVLHSSDAHYLGDIQEREHALRLREGTTSALLAWMRSVKDI